MEDAEQLAGVGHVEAHAVVLDGVGAALCAHGDARNGFVRGEFQRVAGQVEDDLAELRWDRV